jgi:hypothetical protein
MPKCAIPSETDDEYHSINDIHIMNTKSNIQKTFFQSDKMMEKNTQDFFFRADCEKPVLRSRSERGRGYAKARTK